MRVIERQSADPADASHSLAFRARLAAIAAFVEELNVHLDQPLALLAVRDWVKFDFVLKDASGKVVGDMKPILGAAGVQGIHLQTSRPPHGSCDCGLGSIGAAEAAAFLSQCMDVPYSPRADR